MSAIKLLNKVIFPGHWLKPIGKGQFLKIICLILCDMSVLRVFNTESYHLIPIKMYLGYISDFNILWITILFVIL